MNLLEIQSPSKRFYLVIRLFTHEGFGQMKQFHSGCFCPWQFSCSRPCPSFVPSCKRSCFSFSRKLTTWWICQEANLTKWSGKAEGLLLSTKKCLIHECENHSRIPFYHYIFQNSHICHIIQNQCHIHDIDTLETNEVLAILCKHTVSKFLEL